MSVFAKLQLFLGISEAYKTIFNAGFVLVASALIGLSQLGPELYSKDLDAHKLKFEAEYLMKTTITKNTDCGAAGENTVVCRNAVHQLKTLDATLLLWQTFIEWAPKSGVVLMALGFLGFLMPLFGKPNS